MFEFLFTFIEICMAVMQVSEGAADMPTFPSEKYLKESCNFPSPKNLEVEEIKNKDFDIKSNIFGIFTCHMWKNVVYCSYNFK